MCIRDRPEGDPELGRTMRAHAVPQHLGTKSAYEVSSSRRFNMPGRVDGSGYQQNARLAEKLIFFFGAITILLVLSMIGYLVTVSG